MVNQRSVPSLPSHPPGQFLNNAIPRSDQTEDDYPSFLLILLYGLLRFLPLFSHTFLNRPVLVSQRKWCWRKIGFFLSSRLPTCYFVVVLLHLHPEHQGQEQVLKYHWRLILYSEWMAWPQEESRFLTPCWVINTLPPWWRVKVNNSHLRLPMSEVYC